jgi:VWFA-related protein
MSQQQSKKEIAELLGIVFVLFLCPASLQEWNLLAQDKKCLLITVDDHQGNPVKNLRDQELKLEAQSHPVAIEAISLARDGPFTYAFLIDASNSARDELPSIHRALLDFFSKNYREKQDHLYLSFFGNQLMLVPSQIDNINQLNAAFINIKTGNETRIWEALHRTMEIRLKYAVGRKILILISDGENNLNNKHHNVGTVVKLARELSVTITAIGNNRYSDKINGPHGENNLRSLSEGTGGSIYFPLSRDEFSTVFQKMNNDLEGQYYVFFKSPSDAVIPLKDLKLKCLRNKTYAKICAYTRIEE